MFRRDSWFQNHLFKTINDGLSLLIPIHSCSKWKTNKLISKKCSEAKYVDATYKISHILRNVYATDMILVLFYSLV